MSTQTPLLRREAVFVPVLLPEISGEQPIELDYVLPDYYPDFFRLLHCCADAAVSQEPPSGGVLPYTLRVTLRVLYCGSESNGVQAITQSLCYHRSLTLPPDCPDPCRVRITAETAYLNCRAVNQRRIDLRGALRLRARITGEQPAEVLSSAEGLHIQCRTSPVSFAGQLLRTSGSFTLAEELRIPESQPPLLSVLREEPRVTVTETRAAAGKLIVKGEVSLRLLYAAEHGVETIQAVFPFSHLAELPGLEESMPCHVSASLREYLLTPESENDGDIRLLHCDMQIELQALAVRQKEVPLLTDLYSTVHPLTMQKRALPLLTAPVPLHETLRLQPVLSLPDRVLSRVYGAWAEPVALEPADRESGGAQLNGTLRCCVLAADEENRPVMLEDSCPIAWPLPECTPAQSLPPVTVQSCEYNLAADRVTLTVCLAMDGAVPGISPHTLLTDIEIDADTRLPESEEFALRLYFGQPEESLWEIAKRYHTAASAIREENDVPGDRLTDNQLLLIPIVR